MYETSHRAIAAPAIQFGHQILGTKMGVTLEHLHRPVATDRGDLLVRQAPLDQSRYRLVAQVMNRRSDIPARANAIDQTLLIR